jgi:hypothetical protein
VDLPAGPPLVFLLSVPAADPHDQAPDLFGAIAAEILAVALLLYTGILFAARRLAGTRTGR